MYVLNPLTNKEEMPKFIEINGTNISCEKEIKLLGITIDGRLLKFDVNIICKMLILYVIMQLDR